MNRQQRRHPHLQSIPGSGDGTAPSPVTSQVVGFYPLHDADWLAIFEKPRENEEEPVERMTSELVGIMLLNVQMSDNTVAQSFHGLCVDPRNFRLSNPENVASPEAVFVGYARKEHVGKMQPRLTLPR